MKIILFLFISLMMVSHGMADDSTSSWNSTTTAFFVLAIFIIVIIGICLIAAIAIYPENFYDHSYHPYYHTADPRYYEHTRRAHAHGHAPNPDYPLFYHEYP